MISPLRTQYAVKTDDVEYLRHDAGPLLARLYRPIAEGSVPAVVEVHGGAWVSNDRLRNAPLMEELAARGIFGMSIDFTMPPQAGYPASLIDLNAAIRWLKDKAAAFNIDPERIGALGTSSGGHQVLLSALRPDHPRYCPAEMLTSQDASVAFVIACWPIVDPIQRYGMAKAKGRMELVRAHDAYWGSDAAMAEGSPQYILDRNEQTAIPRALLIQGTADDNVDHETMEPFAAAYRQRGGWILVRKFAGSRHGFIRHDLSAPDTSVAIDLIDRFIHQPEGLEQTDTIWSAP